MPIKETFVPRRAQFSQRMLFLPRLTGWGSGHAAACACLRLVDSGSDGRQLFFRSRATI